MARTKLIFWVSIQTVALGWAIFLHPVPKTKWDGQHYSCPTGYDVYADEHEAIANKDFTHCVKSVE